MDMQTLWGALLSCAVGLIGWFARELWYGQAVLRKELSDHKQKTAEEYVTKIDFKDALTDLRSIMQRIYDKLDDKADK